MTEEIKQIPANYPYDIPEDVKKPYYANSVFVWVNTVMPREFVFDFAFLTPDGNKKPSIVSRVVMSRDAAFELSINLQSVLKVYDKLRKDGPPLPPSSSGLNR